MPLAHEPDSSELTALQILTTSLESSVLWSHLCVPRSFVKVFEIIHESMTSLRTKKGCLSLCPPDAPQGSDSCSLVTLGYQQIKEPSDMLAALLLMTRSFQSGVLTNYLRDPRLFAGLREECEGTMGRIAELTRGDGHPAGWSAAGPPFPIRGVAPAAGSTVI